MVSPKTRAFAFAILAILPACGSSRNESDAGNDSAPEASADVEFADTRDATADAVDAVDAVDAAGDAGPDTVDVPTFDASPDAADAADVPSLDGSDVFTAPDAADVTDVTDVTDASTACGAGVELVRSLALPSDLEVGFIPAVHAVPPSACDSSNAPPGLSYRVHVATPTSVRFAVTSGGTRRLSLALHADCDPAGTLVACNVANDSTYAPFDLDATLDPGDYVLTVAAAQDYVTAPLSDVPFALTVSALSPGAAGTTCQNPQPLEPGIAYATDTAASGGPTNTCGLAQAFYSFTLPANQRAKVTVTPTSGHWTPAAGVTLCSAFAGCPSIRGDLDHPLVIYAENKTASDQATLVAVANADVLGGGAYTVLVELTPAPPVIIAACSSPQPVAPGDTLITADSLATEYPSSYCGPFSPPRAYTYQIDVPPQSVLVARDLTNSAIVTAQLAPGCGENDCPDAPHPIGWLTTGASGTTANVVVGARGGGSTPSNAEMLFDVQPVAYTVQTVAGACDDMSAASPLPLRWGYWAQEKTSGFIPMPFPFALGQNDAAYYAVTAYGALRVFGPNFGVLDPLDGHGTSSGTVVPLGTPGLGGMIAAYYRAPNQSSSVGPAVSTEVFTSGETHLTVQWSNFLVASSSAPITFQAKLFSATGRIEVHYCDLGTTGSNQPPQGAVGVQTLDGLQSLQPVITAAGLSTTTGFQFVPGS